MNKWFLILLASVLAILFTACNNSAESVDSSNASESDLTVEEAYSNALDASEEMESVDATINMKQEMSDAENDTVIESTDSDINMQMIMDPFAMHMKEITNVELEGISGNIPAMDTEIYFVGDVMYIYDDYSGNDGDWMKIEILPEDMIEEILYEYPEPSQQLYQMEEYLDDFSIEQTEDTFILKLDVDGEKVNDLVHTLVKENLTEDTLAPLGEEVQEALESLDVSDLLLEMTLDKEMFYLKSYYMEMEMTMESGGEKNNIVQSIESEYTNFNNVDSIEVPADIEDGAIVQ